MQVSRGQSTPISSIPDGKSIKILSSKGVAECTGVTNLLYTLIGGRERNMEFELGEHSGIDLLVFK